MKSLNCSKINLVSFVCVVAVVLIGGAAKADFTFGTPVKVPNINSSSEDFNSSISADGLSLYFVSNRPGGIGGRDIWVATRATVDDNWQEPVNLGPIINTPAGEWGVSISYDGLSLYFDTLQADGVFANDLWVATRATTDDDWGNPVNLGPTVNSPSADDYTPSISADGLSLYFMSNRSGGYGNYDLWVTTRETTDDDWGAPLNLGPTVNSSVYDIDPGISLDGRMLFFTRTTDGTEANIWMTLRATTNDEWCEPINLGSIINSPAFEQYPNVSADGSTLYFRYSQSDFRNGGDIYQASMIPIVDFDSDGVCDIDDLVIMIENWGTSESFCDIGPMPWGDGVVDRADLEVLMGYWNQAVDLAAYYKLDEAEGLIVYDSSEYCLDANAIGDPLWQPEYGILDGSLELDGIDDYVKTPFIFNPANGPFSMFAWVKGGAQGQVILSIGDSSLLSADTSGGCLMTDVVGSRGHLPLLSPAAITDGNWHQIGITWDGSNRTLYVDDIAVASGTVTAMPNSEEGLYIGAGKGLESGSFWTGLIDDVRIHNRAIAP